MSSFLQSLTERNLDVGRPTPTLRPRLRTRFEEQDVNQEQPIETSIDSQHSMQPIEPISRPVESQSQHTAALPDLQTPKLPTSNDVECPRTVEPATKQAISETTVERSLKSEIGDLQSLSEQVGQLSNSVRQIQKNRGEQTATLKTSEVVESIPDNIVNVENSLINITQHETEQFFHDTTDNSVVNHVENNSTYLRSPNQTNKALPQPPVVETKLAIPDNVSNSSAPNTPDPTSNPTVQTPSISDNAARQRTPNVIVENRDRFITETIQAPKISVEPESPQGENSEVNVSIGRIEIRAPQKPSTKPAKPKPVSAKIMSLDDYVHQRMGVNR